jgi:hypothetical protein
MKTKGYEIHGNFTAIPDWYWECNLDLIEVIIIARIASWQRAKKEFFESYESLAPKFNCHYNTVRNKFLKLEKEGIIYKTGKNKRAWKWKVNEVNLNARKDTNKECKNNERNLQPELVLLTPDVNYNTPKTSNKTSFRAEEANGASSPNPKKPTDQDILDFVESINFIK